MTAETATCFEPTVESTRCRRPDPIPSRVAYHHPLTNYERMQAELAQEYHAQNAQHTAPALKRRFSLPPVPENHDGGSNSGSPAGPHPGDVVYWVACLGGACLLLLSATH